MGVSSGPHVEGAALPHPDHNHTPTVLGAILKRAASSHPDPLEGEWDRIEAHTLAFVEKHFTPLPADADDSFLTWLAATNYPEWRKEQLRLCHYAIEWWGDPDYARVKCFIKDEVYAEYKHARSIFSRTDTYKTKVGPIFKLIENEVYKHPAFIKHVPVAQRPAYITEMLGGSTGSYFTSDYTGYESQFREKLMDKCEFVLYRHMTKFLPNRDRFLKDIECLKKPNTCIWKNITAVLPTCRMSGEMNTSLGNGFSNLMFTDYTATKKGCTNIRTVVEGDDGLSTWSGPDLTEEDFAELGLTIKMQKHSSLTTASFCGLVFDPSEGFNIRDPRPVLADFGWVDKKYTGSKPIVLKRLLRAKSLSLAHQYPGCPIVMEMARYGLRVTKDLKVTRKIQDHFSFWYRDQLLEAIKDEKNIKFPEPGPNTRHLVSELYDIGYVQQLHIENYFRNKQDLLPIDDPVVKYYMDPVWNHYYANFTVINPRGKEFFNGYSKPEGPMIREILTLLH